MVDWRKVLDKNPSLVIDTTTGEDLMDAIRRYRRILSQLDEPFPKNFILQDVLNAHEQPTAAAPTKKGPVEKDGP
jgi:hypothetical protein